MSTSVFEKWKPTAYPYEYAGTLTVSALCGGIPSDPKKAEGWLRTKLGTTDELIQQAVAEVMIERGVDADEAVEILNTRKHLNGFKRTASGELFIEGRQLKAAIKEAANVRWPKESWGPSRKGTKSYFAEHFFVLDDRLPLGVTEPSGINQRFVHTYKGSGIQYEECVADAQINFTLLTDVKFTGEQWAMLWLTGEQQGIGATRSMGFGRYAVTKWEKTR